MKLRAVGKRIVAKMQKEEEVVKNGIILTGNAVEEERKVRVATVEYSGIEGVEVGDTVMYSRMFGTVVKDWIVLDEKDGFVIVEEE